MKMFGSEPSHCSSWLCPGSFSTRAVNLGHSVRPAGLPSCLPPPVCSLLCCLSCAISHSRACKTFEANEGGASAQEYSLPFPAGGWTRATKVRKVVHAHSLSQPGPLWSPGSPIRPDLFWTLVFKENLAWMGWLPPRLHWRNTESWENRSPSVCWWTRVH